MSQSQVPLKPKPFIRWAGGKQKQVNNLLKCLPINMLEIGTYFEPFLGGGSLFFALQPRKAFLSDVNEELINCYLHVKNAPCVVYELLLGYASRDSSEFYYDVRGIPSDELTDEERAARFIYLNKAAFNGIYRVNRCGKFNVPYGPSMSGIAIPSEKELEVVSERLANAGLLASDFEVVISMAKKNDLIYLDPPYPPSSATACFTHYSAERFEWSEQLRVAEVFNQLANRGCKVMLTNVAQARIIELYRNYCISRTNVMRCISSNGDRYYAEEIIVTSFER